MQSTNSSIANFYKFLKRVKGFMVIGNGAGKDYFFMVEADPGRHNLAPWFFMPASRAECLAAFSAAKVDGRVRVDELSGNMFRVEFAAVRYES